MGLYIFTDIDIYVTYKCFWISYTKIRMRVSKVRENHTSPINLSNSGKRQFSLEADQHFFKSLKNENFIDILT